MSYVTCNHPRVCRYNPSLLKVPGFVRQFITPIVKASRGKVEKVFYTVPEYEQWREELAEKAARTGKTQKWYVDTRRPVPRLAMSSLRTAAHSDGGANAV